MVTQSGGEKAVTGTNFRSRADVDKKLSQRRTASSKSRPLLTPFQHLLLRVFLCAVLVSLVAPRVDTDAVALSVALAAPFTTPLFSLLGFRVKEDVLAAGFTIEGIEPVFEDSDSDGLHSRLFGNGTIGSVSPKERLARLHDLEDWAISRGAIVKRDSVRIGYKREYGFGWFAKHDLRSSSFGSADVGPESPDALVSVPESLAITPAAVYRTHLSKLSGLKLDPSLEPYRERLVLSAYLVNCVYQTNCPWSAYVATLPRPEDHPLSLTAADTAPFANHTVKEMVDVIRTGLEAIHASLRDEIAQMGLDFPVDRFDFEAFSWGWWVVGARGITRDGATALVPLVDLFNLARGAAPLCLDPHARRFSAVAGSSVRAGAQIFAGYSTEFAPLDTWGWYSWTGFAPKDIPNDLEKVHLRVPFPGPDAAFAESHGGSDPLASQRASALVKFGYGDPAAGALFQFPANLTVPDSFGPFLRFAGARHFSDMREIVEAKGANPSGLARIEEAAVDAGVRAFAEMRVARGNATAAARAHFARWLAPVPEEEGEEGPLMMGADGDNLPNADGRYDNDPRAVLRLPRGLATFVELCEREDRYVDTLARVFRANFDSMVTLREQKEKEAAEASGKEAGAEKK